MKIHNLKYNRRILSTLLAIGISLTNTNCLAATEIVKLNNELYQINDNGIISYERYDENKNEYCNISIFDNENIESKQYGANQKDFFLNFDNLINNKQIWDELQIYMPYEVFDNMDDALFFYKKYFELICECGCGYVAATNYIFHQFEDKEKEFENKFGYPMYTVDENV